MEREIDDGGQENVPFQFQQTISHCDINLQGNVDDNNDEKNLPRHHDPAMIEREINKRRFDKTNPNQSEQPKSESVSSKCPANQIEKRAGAPDLPAFFLQPYFVLCEILIIGRQSFLTN